MTRASKRQKKYDAGMPEWTPFERAVAQEPDDAMIRQMVDTFGGDMEKMREVSRQIVNDGQIFLNSRYQVQVKVVPKSDDTDGLPDMVHLSIKRRDKQPMGRERWRDFQRIKNELVGRECEAVELYPAESRILDTANQYHLWCIADDAWRFPFGFDMGRPVRIPPNAGPAQQLPFGEGDIHEGDDEPVTFEVVDHRKK